MRVLAAALCYAASVSCGTAAPLNTDGYLEEKAHAADSNSTLCDPVQQCDAWHPLTSASLPLCCHLLTTTMVLMATAQVHWILQADDWREELLLLVF